MLRHYLLRRCMHNRCLLLLAGLRAYAQSSISGKIISEPISVVKNKQIVTHTFRLITGILVFLLSLNYHAYAQHTVSKYNLIYHSPASGSWGSMVCGNGDISANVWLDTSGTLYFYIGKSDSRNCVGDLLKITKAEIRFSPSIFKDAKIYKQEFDLQTASFNVTTSKGHLRFWVDANHPQIIVQVNARQPISANVITHVWRRHQKVVNSVPTVLYEGPDSLLQNRKNDIVLFHRDVNTDLFDTTMKLFKLNPKSVYDPFKELTWGIRVSGDHFTNTTDSSMANISPQNNLEIRVTVYSNQTKSSQDWLQQIEQLSDQITAIPANQLFKQNVVWWKRFWNQSYIEISSNKSADNDTVFLLNRAYYYNRYVMNIAAKGKYPIQFNGSTWLVDTYPDTIKSIVGGNIYGKNSDYRLWGNLILWQNMRLPYWTMLATGDTSSMHSLLDFYTDQVYPMMKEFTQKVLGYQGCLFTESTEPWGTLNPYIYGWNRKGKLPEEFENESHQYHYVCGLELLNMLLDYYAYTRNENYLRNKIWPIARDLVTYYETRYPRDKDGKLKIYLARSLESFSDCTNPTPTVAGLHFVLPRLENLASGMNDKAFETKCKNLIKTLPPVPVRKEKEGNVILVAEKAGRHINVEQPDLYAIYPFRLYCLGTPGFKTGRYTFENPSFSDTAQQSYALMPVIKIQGSDATRPIFSWNQTGVQAAYLGFTNYAREILVRSALVNDKRFRFPSFYGPNYDWLPDGDHLALINMTLQSMILQCEGEKWYVLPAWPNNWNVRFKLHAFNNTTIEGTYENGKMVKLMTIPKARIKGVASER
ncbi:MAG: DUF5703 domain-containing protein [Ginsengibacter sp.]